MTTTVKGSATPANAETATKKSAIAKVTKTSASESPKAQDVKTEALKKNKETVINFLKPESSLFLSKTRGGGNHGDHLYREGIIPTDDNRKGAKRKTIRKAIDQFAEAFEFYGKEKDKKNLAQLKSDFDKYYSRVFKTNDYTVASILGGNTREGRKLKVEEMLTTIKGIK